MDNNFFDESLEPDEFDAAQTLIALASDLILSIAVPHTVRAELENPRTPASTRHRASRLPFTMDTGMGDPARLAVVWSAVRGNAMPGKHAADAAHLYDAALWQASYFVTCDKRLLKLDAVIAEVLDDLWIVKPARLLNIYQQYEAHDA